MNIIVNHIGDNKGVYLKDAAPGLWVWDRLDGSQAILLVIKGGWITLTDTLTREVPRYTHNWDCKILVRPFKGNVVFNAE